MGLHVRQVFLKKKKNIHFRLDLKVASFLFKNDCECLLFFLLFFSVLSSPKGLNLGFLCNGVKIWVHIVVSRF